MVATRALGDIYKSHGRFTEAKKMYAAYDSFIRHSAHEASPAHKVRSMLNLGEITALVDDPVDRHRVGEMFDQALKISRNTNASLYYEALRKRGIMYKQQGLFNEAVQHMQRALDGCKSQINKPSEDPNILRENPFEAKRLHCDMEEVIQNLVRQKIREVLKVCGISDGTDEQFKEEIVRISSTVYKTRVESGIEGDFECLPETNTPSTTACSNSKPSITLCRLCFLGSDMRKRKFDKLEGMTQPDKRKRRRSKKVNGSVKEPTGAVASKAAALDRPRELVETGADAPPKTLASELRAAADQLSAGTAVAARSVDTLAGADRPSGDTEPITLADDIHSRCCEEKRASSGQ